MPPHGVSQEERVDARSPEPAAHDLGNKLWAIVRANQLWRSAQDKQVGQMFQDVEGGDLPRYMDQEALARVLVNDASGRRN